MQNLGCQNREVVSRLRVMVSGWVRVMVRMRVIDSVHVVA